MKRIGNLYQQICSLENLRLADAVAQRGKSRQPGVISHNRNREANLIALRESLINKTFTTSEYITFKVYEPKEREVYRLPYYPDRIVHHAVINILEPIFTATFTTDTYSCIKGKGIHAASYALRKALKDDVGNTYCMKLDISKFYPTVDHDILKALLRRKFKDQDLLWLLEDVIDSAPGLPIGNYLSQYFANFYLTYFDHWIKEVKRVKYYFRYADDIVILSDRKDHLHALLADIRRYLCTELKLTVKANYQVFPVSSRGIDFVGYLHFHEYVLLRKSIKKTFARKVAKLQKSGGITKEAVSAHYGWAKHCNSRHLLKKLNIHEIF